MFSRCLETSDRSSAQYSWLAWAMTAGITLACVAGASCPTNVFAAPSHVLTIAADPNNLPFSNEREQGFENRIAKILATQLDADLRYVWRPQRRGFLRDTLAEGLCDFVLGVPEGISQCLTTQPYYRSGYVFVTHTNRGPPESLDDPGLSQLKIAVQLPGDGQLTPPANVLVAHGLASNLVPFSLYSDYRKADPPSQIIRAVGSGEIDVAIAWGPLAAYFAHRENPPLNTKLVEAKTEVSNLPFEFNICAGVRRGDETLRVKLNKALDARREEIRQVLEEFHVPSLRIVQNSNAPEGVAQ
jgi:quinoprotein dehydrogenase-associated probable ABC transporter substrate-binding protein